MQCMTRIIEASVSIARLEVSADSMLSSRLNYDVNEICWAIALM